MREGTATTNPAQRFTVYSKLFQRLLADMPYVGLFVSDSVIALSSKFTFPGYNQWIWNAPWALSIRPAA